MLCLTNHCIKVKSKLILPSVSIFKFCLHYKSRVKQFLSNVSQLKLVTKRLTFCVPWTYIYVRMCLCQQPRYVFFGNHKRIYTSRVCFARNHTVLLAVIKDVYIRHTYALPATKDVYIRFEYDYFLLSVVHVDSFGRWYVVFSILHKKKSVFK